MQEATWYLERFRVKKGLKDAREGLWYVKNPVFPKTVSQCVCMCVCVCMFRVGVGLPAGVVSPVRASRRNRPCSFPLTTR